MSACGHLAHGTDMTQSIIDIAPNVDLYIASTHSHAQTRDATNWMTSPSIDVDVISHSRNGNFEGLGNSEPVNESSSLTTIEVAVANNTTWVNSVGNRAKRIWAGAFRDTSDPIDYYHDYGTTDNSNYVLDADGQLFTGDGVIRRAVSSM